MDPRTVTWMTMMGDEMFESEDRTETVTPLFPKHDPKWDDYVTDALEELRRVVFNANMIPDRIHAARVILDFVNGAPLVLDEEEKA